MKRILWAVFFLILTFTNVGSADTIQTWLGTGLSPLTTSQYPERDTLTRWKNVDCTAFANIYPNWGGNGIANDNAVYGYNEGSCWKYSNNAWELVSTQIPFPVRGNQFAFFNNKLWIIRNRVVRYSDDGINWTIATTTATFPDPGEYAPGLTVFNSKLLTLVPPGVYESSDGITWTVKTTSAQCPGGTLAKLATVNNIIYCHTGVSNVLWQSIDGITWTQIGPTPMDTYWYYPAFMFEYNGKIILSYGASGLFSSPDGFVWTKINSDNLNFIGVHRGHIISGFRNSCVRSY